MSERQYSHNTSAHRGLGQLLHNGLEWHAPIDNNVVANSYNAMKTVANILK